jgi:hypothetical protein
MQRILDEHCHHIPAEEALGILSVDSAKGLDLFEVNHRRERFGPNLLKERKGRNPILQFLLQFHVAQVRPYQGAPRYSTPSRVMSSRIGSSRRHSSSAQIRESRLCDRG